jgi:TonB-dependent starch-binding outer membrane protein SusC
MKLLASLMLIASLHLCAAAYSQKVTISMHNAPLEKVFKEITRQTGYLFFFTDEMLQKAQPVDVDMHNAQLEDVLKQCFQGQPLTYAITDKTIILKVKELRQETPAALPGGIATGQVRDPIGGPITGASVFNRRTRRGTQTDSTGRFSISASEGDVLEISIVGYTLHVYKIEDKKTGIVITMQRAVADLSETVIIGYGSVRKKDVTGSVSVVSSKDIEDIPFTTVDNALAGKAAGVEVTKTDGSPGGAVRIRVRGETSLLGGNTPLYVIDGVPVEVQSNFINPGFNIISPMGNALNAGSGGTPAGLSASFVNGLNNLGGLNVDDIESITILKDASSTAIYGSKAANGVVIITTKKGRKDMKPQIVVSYYGTGSKPINPKLLNKSQYETLITEAAQNDNNYWQSAGGSPQPDVTAILDNPSSFFGRANTNWLDMVTRKTFSNNVELSVQGGGAASKYYTSISYTSTPGTIVGTNYQRVAGKISMENEIGSRFRFNTNINLGYTNQNLTNGAYSQALLARPDYSPYDSSGNFTNFSAVGGSSQGFQNPLALTSATDNAKTLSLLGSVSAQYDITHALQFKSTVSLNMQTFNQLNYTPSYLQIGSFYGSVSSNGGIGANANSTFDDWFIENTLTYDKQFNKKNNLNVLAGTSYETTKASSFSATGEGYPNDHILTSLSSAAIPLSVKGDDPSVPQSYLLSFYLRANYGYMDKYLLTFTGRADGSSKFGPDNKFGYFPSGAIAWRLSKEDFLKDVSWLDDLKLRGSYGLTGTQNIGNQMYRTLYSPFTYNGTNALIPTQLGNAAIKWETTKQTDAGLDFSMFKGRLGGTFDFYNKLTDDALLALPVAPSTSYSTLLQNIVSLKNWGYELSLKGDIIRTRDFRWSASMNITWNKSLVTRLSNTADLTQIGNLSGLEAGNTTFIQGKPLGLITGMQVTGIIRTQEQLTAYKNKLGPLAGAYSYLNIGDPMFLLDTVTYAAFGGAVPYYNAVIASAAPKYYGGFNQEFSYKHFDLNFYFTFSEGGKLLWGEGANSMEFQGTSNADVVMLKRWTPQNLNSNQPRLLLNDDILSASNLNVYNSSYIKLRTLTLNYRFSKSGWMEAKGIQSASVFLSANNVFTITKYPGADPEVSDDPYSVGGGYSDASNYPPIRSFSLGFKVGF